MFLIRNGYKTTSNRVNPSLRASIPVEGSPTNREVLVNREESLNFVVARTHPLSFEPPYLNVGNEIPLYGIKTPITIFDFPSVSLPFSLIGTIFLDSLMYVRRDKIKYG